MWGKGMNKESRHGAAMKKLLSGNKINLSSLFKCLKTILIVLAIGLGSVPLAAHAAKPDYPVIFVHGLKSDNTTWDALKYHLHNDLGWGYGGNIEINFSNGNISLSCPAGDDCTLNGDFGDFYTVKFVPNDDLYLVQQGYGLQDAISIVKTHTWKSKVILVGHSMGGLAARAYLQGEAAIYPLSPSVTYRGDVAKLITIGTPHQGSSGGSSLYYLFGYLNPIAVKELQIPEPGVYNGLSLLNEQSSINSLPLDVAYRSIVGFGGDNYWGDGDGIVTSYSQDMANLVGLPASFNHVYVQQFIRPCGATNTYLNATSFLLDEPIYQVHTCEPTDTGVWETLIKEITPAYTDTVSSPTVINLQAPTQYSPSNNSSIDISAADVSASWLQISGATSYRIMVSENSADLTTDPNVSTCPSCVINDTTASSSYTISASSLKSGATYYWRVKARSATQVGEWSTLRNFTAMVPPQTLLSAPNLNAPINSALGQSDVPTMSWSEVYQATSYRIMVADSQSKLITDPTNPICSACVINDVTASPNYTPPAGILKQGKTYYWQVKARSPNGYGTWSSQWSFATVAACTDSYEPNDSSSQAYGPMSSGSSSSGKICTSTDIDWFKINVTSPGTISLSLSVPSANDYDLELYSPTYSWAAGSNTRGNGLSESISYNATTTGTYYVRVYGYPSGNGSYNATSSYTLSYNFATGNAPIVTTSSASSVDSTGATLNGSIDPNGSSTTTWFEWGTSSTLSTYNSTSPSSPFNSQSTSQATLSGLSPSTTYYYRAAASNNGGTSRGTILNFTTSASQTTQTVLITNGSFSSSFSGWTQQGVDSWAGTNLTNYRTSPGYAALGVDSTGTPKNSADGAFYQTVSIPANATAATLSFWYYITTNETGSTAYDYLYVTVRDSSGNLLASVATLSNVDKTTGYVQKTFDLSPYKGQTIRIRFGATTDSLSTTTFRIDDVSIAVSYSVPSVTTSSASATSTSATLNGSVNPNGSSTNAWFEWGTSSTLSSYTQTSNQSIGSGSTSQAVSASLSGLNPGTTYYYRVAASNSAGTQQGSILSFGTQAAQITTRTLSVASSNPSGVSITVSPNDNNGYGNGTASFTRTYNDKTSVSLSAPATASGNNFQKWQRNGSDYSTSSSTSVTMDADYTMTAVYVASTAQYQLNTSTSPSSGGSISPNCSGGCSYNSGTSVTLTATANSGYTFSSWSGCDSTSGTTCYVTMNSSKAVTAYFSGSTDTTPPTVVSTSPSNNATGVFVNAPVTATFSEGMNSSTITASTFTLMDSGNNLVNGNITYSSTTATFTPSSSLSYNTTYTATITTGVKDAAGNAMQNNYSWIFTTATETVPSQPTLSSPVTVTTGDGQLPKIKKWGSNVYILNGGNNRDLMFYKSTDNGATFASTTLANPVMNYNEYDFGMDANGYLYAIWENHNDSQMYIRKSTDGGSTWSSAATVASGFTWMDQPSSYFSNGTLYLLFRGYKNLKIELYLTKSTDNGSTFSAPVQVTSNGIQEDNGKIAVYGSNVYIIYFDAYSASPYNTYLVKSSDGGNSFGSPVQVNQTNGKSDFGPSLGVDGSGNIFIAYSDTTSDYAGDLYIAKSTDGGSSFTYTLAADSTYLTQGYPKLFIDGNNYVHLLWNDNRDNTSYGSVYYTRSVDGGASYEVNIGIRSSGGISNGHLFVDSDVVNIAATDYKTSPWSTLLYKITWVAADTTPPIVTAVSPLNGATGVPVASTITATFSEAMDASTITTSTFTLDNGVTGTVEYNSGTNTATFTPSSSLAYNTTYTSTLTAGSTGLKDLAGNPLDNPLTTVSIWWSFTTGAASETNPPTTIASPAGGTYSSAQSVTLTANETATLYYSTDGSTPSTVYTGPINISTTTTLKFFAVDTAGNTEAVKTEVYTIDISAPVFTSTSPASNSFINTATAGYSLSKDVASGKITFTRTSGSADSSAHVYNFTASDITAGTHSVNTGTALVNGAIYTVIFEATDSAGNTGSVSSTNVTYDTSSASVTINSPAANSVTNNAKVSYTLSEDISAGDIVFTRTGGTSDSMSPYTYTLGTSERTVGNHTVDTGKVLMDGTIYTVSFENVKDVAGNSTATASNTNVKYDITAVAITNTTPAANSIITGSTVSYTLSEQAQSGKVTFTRTGGAADANSPHVYNLTTSDLTSGSHTVNTNLTLVDGAFYTISFDATDLVGNASTTVSNAMVFYDSNYGIGPTGNVDNTSYSVKRVDGYDLIKLSIAFGSKPGDANWNPVCDINKEGSSNNYIDGLDMTTLGKHFGEVQ